MTSEGAVVLRERTSASSAGPSLRVLINVEALAPNGGISWSALQVAEGLAARGHELHVLYRFDGDLRRDWHVISSTLTQVPGFTVEARSPWRGLAQLPRAVKAAHDVRPDVVWCNRSEQLLWAAAVRRVTGARIVCHLRHHPFSSSAVRPMRDVADTYLAVSEFVRDEWVRSGLRPERVQVVHNGIDPARYPFGGDAERRAAREALGLDQDGFVLLYAGRAEAEKGVDVLLQAWDRLSLDRPSTLLLVGPRGDLVWPSSSMTAGGFRREVRALPQTRDLVPLLHASDALVLPAVWQEPFGRVIIEAMATGRPAVATWSGGIPEILTGEFASLLATPRDPLSLADVLADVGRRIAADPDLGRRCRQHVAERFSLDRVVDVVEQSLLDAVTAAAAVPGRRRHRAAASQP